MGKWLIPNRLSKEELKTKLFELNREYSGKVFKHKNGETYFMSKFSVLNHKGIAEYAVIYYPINMVNIHVDYEMPFNRPATEFFEEGRYTLI